jgi:SAM-dependent methyltransferase
VSFNSPLLRRKVRGRYLVFDVTLSIPSTDPPLGTIDLIMKYLREQGRRKILDFGAGRLRNTWPLLRDKSFDVYACEFEKATARGSSVHAQANKSGLKILIYPQEFNSFAGTFDAVLLSYVLHILPDKKARLDVLRGCYSKLAPGGVLVVASPEYNTPIRRTCTPADAYNDGWVRFNEPRYKRKSFYSEPSREALHKLLETAKFNYDGEWKNNTAKVLRFRR